MGDVGLNENELKEALSKVGYKLEKLTRFKHHDRVRVITTPDETLGFPLTITLTLKKHLEETPTEGLLGALLGEHWKEIVES